MNSASEIKALLATKELFIFDLDGTLFNTLGDLAPAVNFAMNQYRLATHTYEEVRVFIGNGSMNLIRRAIATSIAKENARPLNVRNMDEVLSTLASAGFSDEKVVEIHKTYSDFYWEHCTENTEPYEGVIDLVKRISRQTGFAVALLTNKPVAPTKKILEKYGLEQDFATYLCGDTTPERKPSPAGILAILAKLGAAPQKAVMIGDDTPDVMAARNAGIDCITLLEGFGKPENLLPLQPRYTIGHIKDFASFF